MAISTFNLQKTNKVQPNPIPTAAGLVNHNESNQIKCIFWKKMHSINYDCPSATSMTIEQKKNLLTDRGRCHMCLKFGHLSRRCRTAEKLKCKKCQEKHHVLKCPKNSKDSSPVLLNTEPESELSSTIPQKTTFVGTNRTHNKVFLQTLSVQLISQGKTKTVRAIIDTGSERSYINKLTAEEMNYRSNNEEELIHTLFGGYQTQAVRHKIYKIFLQNPQTLEKCQLEFLDQTVICNNIVPVTPGPWMSELLEYNIQLSDVSDGDIEILIGVDFAGSLYTGRVIQLECGLTALETRLGWTLMGKITASIPTSLSSIVILRFCQNSSLENLWQLDILGITDSVEEKSKLEKNLAVMKNFKESLTRWQDGRYEVSLPWKNNRPPLVNNYENAKIKLEKQVIKAKKMVFIMNIIKFLKTGSKKTLLKKFQIIKDQALIIIYHIIL